MLANLDVRNVCMGILSLLFDSGASICAIKYEKLSSDAVIYKHRTEVKGINGLVFAEGYTIISFNIGGLTFEDRFYVFRDIDCGSDGIIGETFLNKYRVNIDYDLHNVTLKIGDESVVLNVKCERKGFTYLPPKCEVIRVFRTDVREDSVIVAEQLSEGVFVASTVVRPNKEGEIPVRMLNTSDTQVVLKSFKPTLMPLNKYDICKFDPDKEVSVDRVKEFLKLLKLNELNTEEQREVENICAKYADIFHMPGDKLGTTGVYQQKIALRDNATPVYVKPYRLPQVQKKKLKDKFRTC